MRDCISQKNKCAGPQHTIVTLTLACKKTGRVYTVQSLRHQYHEYSKPAEALEEEGQGKVEREKALEIMRREEATAPLPVLPLPVKTEVSAQAGYVGLRVSQTRPHSIVQVRCHACVLSLQEAHVTVKICAQVDDLVDANMVRQGEPGYSNPSAAPGDLILKIDGQDAQTASLPELHDMLRGKMSCA